MRALAALALLASLATGGSAQDGAAPEVEADLARIEKYLELARSGRLPVRPQAARRLVGLGAPAADRLVEECGEDGRDMDALGQHLVEALADAGDERLRALLWKRVVDPGFAWRAPAARGLAAAPRAEERGGFLGFTRDRLAEVRRAGVLGLAGLEHDEEQRALVLRRLQDLALDPRGRVRRAAAAALHDLGQSLHLYTLSLELERQDDYFGVRHGEAARFEALRLLEERLGGDLGFEAERGPEDEANAAALAALRERIIELTGGALPMVSGIVMPGGPTEGDVLGLELRSCRAGEVFLRWNERDELLVGTGRPARVALEPGTVARLRGELAALLEELGDRRFWGEAGCDLEQLRVVGADGELRTYLVSKGQAAVEGLRPAALARIEALLLATLPDAWPGPGVDPRTEVLRRRTREVLEAVGGPLGGE
jgi:hypothetical protein